MQKVVELYRIASTTVKNSVESQMFGKPCFKIGGKAFVCFFDGCMVFKLGKDVHQQALHLDGSKLFDPSDKGRPMKEWVQVHANHSEQWKYFAQAAAKYVSEQK